MKDEFLLCRCYSDEHTLHFILDEKTGEIYTSVYLHQYYNIYKKIWCAIKYIFGYKCKYGSWDSFMMRPEDYERFKELVTKSEEIIKNSPKIIQDGINING